VSVGVVEVLEVIQIEHQDTERLFGTDGAGDFALEHFLQIASIV